MAHFFWTPSDRQAVGAALLAVVGLLLASALLPPQQTAPQKDTPPPPEPALSRDSTRTVRLLQEDGTVAVLSMGDYLWGVVAAEMPASFQPEALKAQACAARTYTLTRSGKHPEADVCTDSHCCQAYITREAALERWGKNGPEYAQKIAAAVAETDGLGILYEGKPIQALFFSSAPGQTVDAVEVWGTSVSYLKSVKSPEGSEVPNYQSRVVLSPTKVREAALAAWPDMDLSGDPAGWFTDLSRSPSGSVASLKLGGVALTGGQVRKLFSLRSAAFTPEYDGRDFVFQVVGHGHGVGMSQYGANAMAAQGAGFREILQWYYTGVEVALLW